MAYVQGPWIVSTLNKRLIMKCTLTATTSETDMCTLKTPKGSLDPTKAWNLIVNAAGTSISSNVDPVDIWAGYTDSFSGDTENGTITVTDGYEVGSGVMDDVSDDALVTTVDPNFTTAKVVGVSGTAGHINVGVAPYYIINIDGGGTLNAADTIIYIVQ